MYCITDVSMHMYVLEHAYIYTLGCAIFLHTYVPYMPGGANTSICLKTK